MPEPQPPPNPTTRVVKDAPTTTVGSNEGLTVQEQSQAVQDARLAWKAEEGFHVTVLAEIRNSRVLFEAVARGDLDPEQASVIQGTRTGEIIHASGKDSLTGFEQKTEDDETIVAALELAYATKTPLSIIMFDLDHFKRVNDTLGHKVGDLALKSASSQIKRRIRTYDKPIRYGGDEFIVVAPNTNLETAVSIARRIGEEGPEEIEQEMQNYGYQLPETVTYSAGVVEELPLAFDRAAAKDRVPILVKLADTATYIAKDLGRNTVVSGKLEEGVEIYTHLDTGQTYSVERDEEGKVIRTFKYPEEVQ